MAFLLYHSVDDGSDDEDFTSVTLGQPMGVNRIALMPSCRVVVKVMNWMMKLYKPFCQRPCLRDSDSDSETTDETDPVTLQR